MADITLRSGIVAAVDARVAISLTPDPVINGEGPSTIKAASCTLTLPIGEPMTVSGGGTGSCYLAPVKLPSPPDTFDIISGGVTFSSVNDALNSIVPAPVADVATKDISLHVGNDGLQITDKTLARLRWAPAVNDKSEIQKNTSIWTELTAIHGVKISEHVSHVINDRAVRAIELHSVVAKVSNEARSSAPVHAILVKDGETSAAAFSPPFALSLLGAEWCPSTCWVWEEGDNEHIEFTDLPFSPRTDRFPWDESAASGTHTVTITLPAGNVTKSTISKLYLVATGRVTDGINDLPVAWQYTDVKTSGVKCDPGVWVQWRIPRHEAPARVAVEAASLSSGIQGLFRFEPATGDGWQCEVGLRPRPTESSDDSDGVRIRLRLTKTGDSWSSWLRIDDPQVFASTPELRFLGLPTTDPESLPHAPALDAALIKARVEFASFVAPADEASVTLDNEFKIAAGDHVRAWLPTPWAGIDDGDLTGPNLPTTSAAPAGRADTIARDRNQGLLPVECGKFTLDEIGPDALVVVKLSGPAIQSADDRGRREVVAALLPWVTMQDSAKPGAPPAITFTPYHRNLILEHFEDRESTLPRTFAPASDAPASFPPPGTAGRSRRVRDRYARAAEGGKLGDPSSLLNWLPTIANNARGTLKTSPATKLQAMPTLTWTLSERHQELSVPMADSETGVAKPPDPLFLSASVTWNGSPDPAIAPPSATPNSAAGHVPPVFSTGKDFFLDTLAVNRPSRGPEGDSKHLDIGRITWATIDYRIVSTVVPIPASAAQGKRFVLCDNAETGHSIALMANEILLEKKEFNTWAPLVNDTSKIPPLPLGTFGVFAATPLTANELSPMHKISNWPRVAGWPFLATGVSFDFNDAPLSVNKMEITGLLLNPVDLQDLDDTTVPEFARRVLSRGAPEQIKIKLSTVDNGGNWTLTDQDVTGGFYWSFPLTDQISPIEAPRSIPGRIEQLVGTTQLVTGQLRLKITPESSRAHALGASWPLTTEVTLVPEDANKRLALRELAEAASAGTLKCRRVLPHVPGKQSLPLAIGRGKDDEAVVATGANADDIFVSEVDSGELQVRCRDRYRDGMLIRNGRASKPDNIQRYEAVLVHVDGSLHVVPAMDSTKNNSNKWTFTEPDANRPSGSRRFELDSPIESAIAFDGTYGNSGTKLPHRLYLCRCADGSARLLDDQSGELQRFDLPGTTVTAMAFGPNVETSQIRSAATPKPLSVTDPPSSYPLTFIALGAADGSVRVYEIPHDIAHPNTGKAGEKIPAFRQWFDQTGVITSLALYADRYYGTESPKEALVVMACSRGDESPLIKDVLGHRTRPDDYLPAASNVTGIKVSTTYGFGDSQQDGTCFGCLLAVNDKGRLTAWTRRDVNDEPTPTQATIDAGPSFAWTFARGELSKAYLITVAREGTAQPDVYEIPESLAAKPVANSVTGVTYNDCLSLNAVVGGDSTLLVLAVDGRGFVHLHAINESGALNVWKRHAHAPFAPPEGEATTPLAAFTDTIVDVVTRLTPTGRVEVWDVGLDCLRWKSPEACGLFQPDDIDRVRFAFIRQRPILAIGRHNEVEFWNLATGRIEHRLGTDAAEITHLDVALYDDGTPRILVGGQQNNGTLTINIHTLDGKPSVLLSPLLTGTSLGWLRFYRQDEHFGVAAISLDGPTANGRLWKEQPLSTFAFTIATTKRVVTVVVDSTYVTVTDDDGTLYRGEIASPSFKCQSTPSTRAAVGAMPLASHQEDETGTCLAIGGTTDDPILPWISFGPPQVPSLADGVRLDTQCALSLGWRSLGGKDSPINGEPFNLVAISRKGWCSNLFSRTSDVCGPRSRTLPEAPFRLDAVNWPSVVGVTDQGGHALVRVWDRHSGIQRHRFVVEASSPLPAGGILAIGSAARPQVWLASATGIRSIDWAIGRVRSISSEANVTFARLSWDSGVDGEPNLSGVAMTLKAGDKWLKAACAASGVPDFGEPPDNTPSKQSFLMPMSKQRDKRNLASGWGSASLELDSRRVILSRAPELGDLRSSLAVAQQVQEIYYSDSAAKASGRAAEPIATANDPSDNASLLIVSGDASTVFISDCRLYPDESQPSRLVSLGTEWQPYSAAAFGCLVISDELGLRIVACDGKTRVPVVLSPASWLRIASDTPLRADLQFRMGERLTGRVTPARQCEVLIDKDTLPGISVPLTARPSLVQSDCFTFTLALTGPPISGGIEIESGAFVLSGVRPAKTDAIPLFDALAVYERLVSVDEGALKVGNTPVTNVGSTQARLLVTAKLSSSPGSPAFEVDSITVTGSIKASAKDGSEPAWQLHLAEQAATTTQDPNSHHGWAFLAQRPLTPTLDVTKFAWQGFVPITCTVNFDKATLEVALVATPFLAVRLDAVTGASRPRGLPTVRDDVVLPQPPDLDAVVALNDQVIDLADGQIGDLAESATSAVWCVIAAKDDCFTLQKVAGADAVPLDFLGGIKAVAAMPKLGLDALQLTHRRDHGGRLRAASPAGMKGIKIAAAPEAPSAPRLLLLPAIEIKGDASQPPRARLMYETLVLGALPLPTRDRGLRSEMQTESVIWVTPQGIDATPRLTNLLSATAAASTRGQLPEAIFTDGTIRALAVDAGASGLLLKRTLDAAGCVSLRFVNSPYHAIEPQTLED